MKTINPPSNVEHCWNIIGVTGDRSCPELSTQIHCQNCPVYSRVGRNLLERSLFENYRYEWTEFFAQTAVEKPIQSHTLLTTETLTVIIFRLQQEWLALSAHIFQETTPPSVVHTLPHRSNQILRGLVNIRGELHLCISLSHLLNLQVAEQTTQSFSPVMYSRLLVITKATQTWVFAVDEIYGIHRLHHPELREPPQNRVQGDSTYSQGVFHWHSRSVSYLDDELLFVTLAKKVLP